MKEWMIILPANLRRLIRQALYFYSLDNVLYNDEPLECVKESLNSKLNVESLDRKIHRDYFDKELPSSLFKNPMTTPMILYLNKEEMDMLISALSWYSTKYKQGERVEKMKKDLLDYLKDLKPIRS